MKASASWLALGAIIFLSLTAAPAQITPATESPDSAHSQTVHPPQQLKVTEYRLPPDELVKAEALYKTRTVLYLFGLVFGILVLWLLLKLRVAPAFRNLAERASGNGFVQALIFVPLLMLLIAIISPAHRHVRAPYLARLRTLSARLGVLGRRLVQGRGSVPCDPAFAVFGLFRIIRKSPQRWWFYFWLVTLPFLVLLIFVAPVILDPMFNKFEPLEKTRPQLVGEIEKVTQRGGLNIPRDRMFEMEASAKVTTYNAYVTGIGTTKRVVVWDNTSHDMTVPETLFVFGHEMGHYVLNHIYKGSAAVGDPKKRLELVALKAAVEQVRGEYAFSQRGGPAA